MSAIHWTGGHGFYLEFPVIGDGWDIANLSTLSVIVRWRKPNGQTTDRDSSSGDLTVTKAPDNSSVLIRVLVKSGDHNQPGTYTLQAFDTTGNTRVPAPPILYDVEQGL
jgi:hypothetical protein